MKICKVCGETKPLEQFHRAAGMRDGHRNECKSCLNARHRGWYERNREYAIERTRRWARENPERLAETRRKYHEEHREERSQRNRASHLQRKYGLSPDDVEFLVVAQGGKCRICGAAEGKKLHVDHHHDSGLVRGLLCGKCNKAIGLLNEDPQLFEAATSYLRENQLPLSCGDRARKRSRVRRPSTPSRPGDR